MKLTAAALFFFICGVPLQAVDIATQLISHSPTGQPTTFNNTAGSIDGGGNFIAFSNVSDLAGGPTPDFIYIYSAPASGVTSHQAPSGTQVIGQTLIASGGGIVAYQADNSGGSSSVILKVAPNTFITPATTGGSSYLRGMSRGGGYAILTTNNEFDLSVYNTTSGVLSPLNLQPGTITFSIPSAAVSADGNIVAYLATYSATSTTSLIVEDIGASTSHTFDLNAATPSYLQGFGDEYVLDVSMSDDARYIAYTKTGTSTVDVALLDRQTGIITDLAPGKLPSISADGHYIAFSSASSSIVPGDANGHEDVFRYDTAMHTFTLVSLSSSGTQGNGDSFRPSISSDGSKICYLSKASNLASGDTNMDVVDVFISSISATSSTTTAGSTGGTSTTSGSTSAGSTATAGGTTTGSTTSTSSSSPGHCGVGGGLGLFLSLFLYSRNRRLDSKRI